MVSYNRIYYFKLSFMKGFHILCLHIFVYSLSKFQLFIFAINYEHVLHNHTFLLHYIYQSACALFQGQIFFPFSILYACLFSLQFISSLRKPILPLNSNSDKRKKEEKWKSSHQRKQNQNTEKGYGHLKKIISSETISLSMVMDAGALSPLRQVRPFSFLLILYSSYQ